MKEKKEKREENWHKIIFLLPTLRGKEFFSSN